MRRGALLALCLSLLASGCANTRMETRQGGTERVFDGKRVVGRYVSPNAYEHYVRAQLASNLGNGAEAAQELARAIASDGTSAYLRTRLGEELLALGRLDEARESLEAALRFDPEFAEAHVELGRIALRLGDVAGAEAAFRKALDLDRTCEAAYLALAQLYRERGDVTRADGVYRTMAERLPQSPAAHLQLSRSALARGDLKAAEVELRQAARLDPAALTTQVELGRLLLSAGKPAEAEHELVPALERSGRDPVVAELLVQVLVALGKGDDADALVDSLDNAAGPRERRLAVAWLLLSRNRADRAAAIGGEVLAGGELAAARLLRGASLIAMHKIDDALGELSRVPPESPEYVTAQLRIGRALADAGRVKEATDLVVAALARAPARAETDLLASLLSELCERAGDRARARRVLDDALKLHPKSDALAYALGGLLDRAGEADRAIDVVNAILERAPDSAEALNFIGWSWTDRGVHLKEAQKYLERARALRPASGEIADSLGWLYFKIDRFEDAVKQLELALRLLPEAPDVAAHLGDAYDKRGDRQRAVAAWRRALAHNPDARVRQAVEEKLIHLEEGRVGAR